MTIETETETESQKVKVLHLVVEINDNMQFNIQDIIRCLIEKGEAKPNSSGVVGHDFDGEIVELPRNKVYCTSVWELWLEEAIEDGEVKLLNR